MISSKQFVWFVVILIFSIFLDLYIHFNHLNNFSLTNIINGMFLTGLTLLIIGTSIFVVQGGFFTNMKKSFRHFFKRISKKAEYIEEYAMDNVNDDDKHPLETPDRHASTYPLILIGLLYFGLSIFLLLFLP